MEIEETLKQREKQYGSFLFHAKISQDLKHIMAIQPNYAGLSAIKKEALEMIVHKIARIINGDSNLVDSWHDISGYAKLVEDHLSIRGGQHGKKSKG